MPPELVVKLQQHSITLLTLTVLVVCVHSSRGRTSVEENVKSVKSGACIGKSLGAVSTYWST